MKLSSTVLCSTLLCVPLLIAASDSPKQTTVQMHKIEESKGKDAPKTSGTSTFAMFPYSESVAVTSGMQPSPGCGCYPSDNAPSILQVSPNQNVTVHVGQPVQLRYDGSVICHRQMIWDMTGKAHKSVDQLGDLTVGSVEWEVGSLWALPLEWGVVTYSGYVQAGTYQVTFKLMLQCHDDFKNCTHTCVATKTITINVVP
jgi:hypothetical protein